MKRLLNKVIKSEAIQEYEEFIDNHIKHIILEYVTNKDPLTAELEEKMIRRMIETGKLSEYGNHMHGLCPETNKVFARTANLLYEARHTLHQDCQKYASSRLLTYCVMIRCFHNIDQFHLYSEVAESESILYNEITYLVAMFFDDNVGDFAAEMVDDNVFSGVINMYKNMRSGRFDCRNPMNTDVDDDDITTELTNYSVPHRLYPSTKKHNPRKYRKIGSMSGSGSGSGSAAPTNSNDEIYLPATGLNDNFYAYYNQYIRDRVRTKLPPMLLSEYTDAHDNLRRMIIYVPFVLMAQPPRIYRILDVYKILSKDAPQFSKNTALGLCLFFQFMTASHLRLCYEFVKESIAEFRASGIAILV